MKTYLHRRLPLPTGKTILGETLFLAAYLFFVLVIFQPFGTHEYEHPYKLAQLLGYVLIVLLLYPLAKKGFLFYKNDPYFLKEEALILFLVLFILIVLSFFYYSWAIQDGVVWGYLPSFAYFGIMCLLPAYAALLYRAGFRAQKHTAVATTGDKLEIKGASAYEQLYFNASDVLYLKSNGNYVMIYFRKENRLKQEMLRNTLSQVTGQLAGTDIISIHRSFMVNAKKFDRLVREDGKHLLVNQEFDIRLPVSRNNVSAVEQKLKDHSSFPS